MTEIPVSFQEVEDSIHALEILGRDTKKQYLEQMKFEKTVQNIITRVIRDQDAALRDITFELDKCLIDTPRVKEKELDDSWNLVSKQFKEDLERLAAYIKEYHRKNTRNSWWYRRGPHILAEINRAIDTVALYTPGGRTAYPSSLLMTAIPAHLAGVRRLVILTPPGENGTVHPSILATAKFLGINEVYRVGGAQAVAAAAFGTETIPRVDKIVGPGNIYVTLAKKLLSDVVGIDILAGPSEVVILAEPEAPVRWIALDMLAQSEHDPLAQAVLISTSQELLTAVGNDVKEEILKNPLSFERTIPLWLLKVPHRSTAWHIADGLAPEHLEIIYPEGEDPLEELPRAGAVFLGPSAPVALGDYGFGPNHVLPTSGGSRFSSPLGVEDFLTRSSLIKPGKKNNTPQMELHARFAEAEGLTYHRLSLLARMEQIP